MKMYPNQIKNMMVDILASKTVELKQEVCNILNRAPLRRRIVLAWKIVLGRLKL